MTWSPHVSSIYFLVLSAIVLQIATAADFASCKAKVERILNGTAKNESTFDIQYYGKLRGFQTGNAPRPITLTLKGCKEACGSSSDPNDVLKAFQILTTWVLPALALFSQLPYESGEGTWKNFEAFINWIGAPASALTTTIFNMSMIQRAQKLSANDKGSVRTEAYYVLCCINQYEYPYEDVQMSTARDRALLYGLLRPVYFDRTVGETRQLYALLDNLAFQLRLQRRKAVLPLVVNIVWFMVAFGISIAVAFTDLGDNTTAHSLALGLLISWLPILVIMAIVDRNPVNAGRCKILIERWLYNVDQILDPDRHRNPPLQVNGTNGANGANAIPLANRGQSSSPLFWQPKLQERPATQIELVIGDFIGQGRRLQYCGLAHAVMALEAKHEDVARRAPEDLGGPDGLKAVIFKRPKRWFVIWIVSLIIVSISFGMAFMVSFKTPTIGLGCRSLMYLLFYVLSLVSWVLQILPRWFLFVTRPVAIVTNTGAMLAILLVMIFQITNGFNRCGCKVSRYGGKGYGGYMDFENAVSYRQAYEVSIVWALAASFGGLMTLLCVVWAGVRWMKSKSLWKTPDSFATEQGGYAPGPAELTPVWLT